MAVPAPMLLCPTVIGRDAELITLADLVDRVHRGHGAAAAIVGEPGIGKSRLTREVAALAQTTGLVVGVGRCRPGAGKPFEGLSEALLGAARSAGVPQPDVHLHHPQLAHVVAAWADHRRAVDVSRVSLGEAVLAAAGVLGRECGLLLVVEDVHWSDTDTVDLLGYVADNLRDLPVGLLLTSRPEPQRHRVLRDLAGRDSLALLELNRLAADDSRRMVQACLEGAPEDLVDRIVSSSAGLPLLIEDLAAAQRTGTAPSATTTARFSDLVLAQLDTLDAVARSVVETAAVFGHDADSALVAAASGSDPEQVEAAVAAAGAAQLMTSDPFGFRHALTSEVIWAGMAPSRRTSLARSCAEAAAGAPALEARLWAAADEPARAAASHLLAAATASAQHALALAESHLRAATALAPDDLVASVALLDVLVPMGKGQEALSLGARILDRLPAGDREAVRRQMIRAAIACDPARAASLLAQTRQHGTAAEAAELAVLEAQLALLLTSHDRLVAAEHLGHRAAAAAEDATRPDLLCEALEVVGRCARLRNLGSAADAFERALAVATDNALELWRIRALNELGTIDMFREADATRLRLARDAACAAGALLLEGGAAVNLAAVLTMRGELAEAELTAKRAEDIGRRSQNVGLTAAGLVFQGVVATHAGRWSDMQRHVRAAEALAGDDPDVVVGTWGMCRAMAGLLREDHAGALEALETAARKLQSAPALAISPVDGPLLLLRAIVGKAGRAGVLEFQQQQAIGARWSVLWGSLAEAAVLGAAGAGREATAATERAIDAGRPMPLFSAVGLRLVGGAAVRQGWGEPVRWLTDARESFEGLGHERPAAACRSALRAAGAAVPRQRGADAAVPDGLRGRGITGREAEVLELVLERLPNREIAQRLFLSPRTVEKHVASLLTKTGADNRDALVRMAFDAPAHG